MIARTLLAIIIVAGAMLLLWRAGMPGLLLWCAGVACALALAAIDIWYGRD